MHTILGTMGEFELNDNEKFVNCFGSLLTEALKDAYFIETDTVELLELFQKAQKWDELHKPVKKGKSK